MVRLGATYPLPYFDTETFCEVSRDGVRYRSVRTHKGAPAARLVISYRDVGETFESRPGKLENFLTQRYCFYSVEKTDVCGAATSTTVSARGRHRGAPDNRPDRRAPDTEPLLPTLASSTSLLGHPSASPHEP